MLVGVTLHHHKQAVIHAPNGSKLIHHQDNDRDNCSSKNDYAAD